MKDNVLKTDYGYEVVWAQTDEYCGKILVFEKANNKLPLHFHKNKNKSWFVNTGKFKVQWIDTADGKSYVQELTEGNTFHILALTPVMLESLSENGAIAEVSNGALDDFYKLG
jgi:hypothetical protein